MADGVEEQKFKEILDKLHSRLKLSGYSKKGAKFLKRFGDNAALMQIQRSRYNDSNSIKFTINTSIVSAKILRGQGLEVDIDKVSEWHGHLRRRIGWFCDRRQDKWWIIDASANSNQIAAEVLELIEIVIPHLESNASDSQLLALWKSGYSPGITEFQRTQYSSMLEETA